MHQAGAPAARLWRGGVEWVLGLSRIRDVLAWATPCSVPWSQCSSAPRSPAAGRGGRARFGAALNLNLNVHVHALVLDGVFAEDGSSDLRFHAATPPTDEKMDEVLDTLDERLGAL